ncbi:MAG: hypothetical protein HKN63_08720 [Rhodobacteraceae bacterium]|nr:hypothetical protein [Paracoccaceae bacterium]
MALGLPQKAAFMPLLIGVPGVILCLWQLVLDLRRPPDRVEAPDGERDGEGRTEVEIFLWLGAFSVALIGFGFVVGGPLVVLAFVRFASGESWQNALLAGAGTFAVVFGVFIWLLELPLFQGLILEAIL